MPKISAQNGKKGYKDHLIINPNQYFVKILGNYNENEIPPLEYIDDKIEQVILNNRKTALLKSVREQLYQKISTQKNNLLSIVVFISKYLKIYPLITFRFLPFILFFFLLTESGFSQDTNLLDKVVAKVGSEYILSSEVEEEFSYASKQKPDLGDDAKCSILENIIEQKVIIYQAKLDSIEITDEEVETQLDFRFDAVLRQMNGDESF